MPRLWMENFVVPCRLVPGYATPRIRFLFIASHLRYTLPSVPASLLRPCASLTLRLHDYLGRGLSPPSIATCTAHTLRGPRTALSEVTYSTERDGPFCGPSACSLCLMRRSCLTAPSTAPTTKAAGMPTIIAKRSLPDSPSECIPKSPYTKKNMIVPRIPPKTTARNAGKKLLSAMQYQQRERLASAARLEL